MMQHKCSHAPIQWMVIIVDRGKAERISQIFHALHIAIHLVTLGHGTASSAMMDYLGLDEPEKEIILSLIPTHLVPEVMRQLRERMELPKLGKGIAFTLPLSGISAASHRIVTSTDREERASMPEEKQPVDKAYELIVSIIPHGQSDLVMTAAKAAGATGGTVVRARAYNNGEAERFLGITIQPEKELVLILAPTAVKRAIMQSICDALAALQGERGLVFSLPIAEVMGIHMPGQLP